MAQPANQPPLDLELRVAGIGSLRVMRFSARERLSAFYDVEVEALCPEEWALEEVALEQPASLTLRRGDAARVFHGVVRSLRVDGFRAGARSGQNLVQYTLSLAPRAWLLSTRKSSRIFQNRRVTEVIRTILDEYAIPNHWVLDRTYPAREYCTQYEETDLEFIERLAAEAGLFYAFEQPRDVGWSSNMPPEAEQAMGAAMGLGERALSGLGPLGEAAAGVAGQVAGMAGMPREVMVFSDTVRSYSSMSMGDGPSWEELARHVAQSVESLVASMVPDEAQPLMQLGSSLASGSSPTLVISDAAQALRHDGAYGLWSFRRERQIVPRRFTFREFDPRRPLTELSATQQADGLSPEHLLDKVAHGDALQNIQRTAEELGTGALEAARNRLSDATAGVGEHLFEIYDHHSGFILPDWDYEREEPERMQRSAQRHHDVIESDGDCPFMEAGRRFTVAEHGLGRLNREYVCVEVVHRVEVETAGDRGTYTHHVVAVPAHIPYVPERPPRRAVQTCLTATVLAAEDTRIHTDAGARIMVRFHWDRGQPDHEYNTCWIRVMQSWAGAGWGSLFIPRAGMEVVVAFEGGDPDRPLVLGCLYNGANPPPFVLPEHKTRAGFRTQTTPGVEGSNELWFEDSAGHERIYVHAQKDYEQVVENDRSVRVHHDHDMHVHADHRMRVDGEAHRRVAKNEEHRVDQDQTVRVDGNRQVTVGESARHAVSGDEERRVGGGLHDEVVGSRQLITKGDLVVRSGGNLVQVVGGGGSPRSFTTHVEGRLQMSASKSIQLSATDSVEIRCGDSVLRMTPDKITVESKEIGLQAKGARARFLEGEVRIQADDKIQAVAPNIVLIGESASVGLSSEASVQGNRVLLNSPAQASDQVEPTTEEPTVIELVDDEGQPLANRPYRITLGDGSEVTGVTDDQGRAEVLLDEGGEITFPGLDDVEPQ